MNKRAIYRDSDFMTYEEHKDEESFMEDYSKEFLTYNSYKRHHQPRNRERFSRSFRLDEKQQHRQSKPLMWKKKKRFRIWSAFEQQIRKEEEEGKVKLKKKEEPSLIIDDECPICMDKDNRDSMEHLECGHSFHSKCLASWIEHQPGKGERFLTSNARCPLCRVFIWTKTSKDVNKKIWKIKKKGQIMSDVLLTADGIDKDHLEILKKKKSASQVNSILEKYIFYSCYSCNDLYFGGLQDCQNNANEELEGEDDVDEEEEKKKHVCPKCFVKRCSSKNFPSNCKIHGDKFISFKCRYCCNIAYYFCFGTTHFCYRCHSTLDMKVYPCKGNPECSGHHVENGTEEKNEQCLGCTLCRQK